MSEEIERKMDLRGLEWVEPAGFADGEVEENPEEGPPSF